MAYLMMLFKFWDYTVLNGRRIDELEMIWKEAGLA
jgi:hypothetical protein